MGISVRTSSVALILSQSQLFIEHQACLSTATEGIRKDLQTLDLFVRRVDYQRAIYLIYGHEANARGVGKIETIANEFQELAAIVLWLHSLHPLVSCYCQIKLNYYTLISKAHSFSIPKSASAIIRAPFSLDGKTPLTSLLLPRLRLNISALLLK